MVYRCPSGVVTKDLNENEHRRKMFYVMSSSSIIINHSFIIVDKSVNNLNTVIKNV